MEYVFILFPFDEVEGRRVSNGQTEKTDGRCLIFFFLWVFRNIISFVLSSNILLRFRSLNWFTKQSQHLLLCVALIIAVKTIAFLCQSFALCMYVCVYARARYVCWNLLIKEYTYEINLWTHIACSHSYVRMVCAIRVDSFENIEPFLFTPDEYVHEISHSD